MSAVRWRVLVLAIALCGCHPSAHEREVVRHWLLCEECVEGELDSVVALGDNVLAPLKDALVGPPATGRANITHQAESMYALLTTPRMTQAVYVDHFVGNYVATYQKRAAIALDSIDTPRARAQLRAAALTDTTSRADVRQVLDSLAGIALNPINTPRATAVADTTLPENVRRALGSSAGIALRPVPPDTLSAPADSLVRRNPSVTVMVGTQGQPLAGVPVTFRVISGGGRADSTSIRTDSSGVASVRWRLGPGVGSLNMLEAHAAGMTRRFYAIGRGSTPRLAFVLQPSGVQRSEPMTPAIRIAVLDAWGDTVRTQSGIVHLRVVAPSGTAILSRLDSLVHGQVSFQNLRVSKAGSAFRLTARTAGLTTAVSDSFDVFDVLQTHPTPFYQRWSPTVRLPPTPQR